MKTIYRILAPVFAVLLLASFFFVPILRVKISSSLAPNIMSTVGLKENIAVKDVVDMSKNEKSSGILTALMDTLKDKDSIIGAKLTTINFLYAALVLLILALLVILAVAVLGALMKKHIVPTALTAGAMALLFAANKCFDAFAVPFLNGKIGLSSLINSSADGAAALGSLLGSLVKMEELHLGLVYSLAMFGLGIVLVLGVCAIAEQKLEKK